MNIIPLDKQPKVCPVCGRNKNTIRACSHVCTRVSLQTFVDTRAAGDKIVPHVHVICSECGFVYLTDCLNPGEVEILL